jgi:hypothetical protein
VTVALARANQPDVLLFGQRAILRQMDYLHVMVFGRWSPKLSQGRRVFAVESANARAQSELVPRFDGTAPIFDGILRREAEDDFLEMPDGRRLRIAHLPRHLWDADGRRVLFFDSFETPTGTLVIEEKRRRQTGPPRTFARDSIDFPLPDTLQTLIRSRQARAHGHIMEMNRRTYERFRVELGPGMCACGFQAGGTPRCPPPGVGDSARGVLRISEAATADWFAVEGGSVQLDGNRRFLRQFAGLEIAAFGTRVAPRCLAIHHVLVRAAHGRPAHDGILRREPHRDVLETALGQRLTIRRLPAVLRDADGRRVWIAGSLNAPSAAAVVDTSTAPLERREPD